MTAALPGLPGADQPEVLLEQLAERAGAVLSATGGADALVLERQRSLGDRLAGRPGRPAALRLTTPEQILTLRLDQRRLVAETARVSGGIVIARRSPPLGEWLGEFAGRLAALAADSAGDAAAAGHALAQLGVRTAGADVTVSEHDVDGGLVALPLLVRGRLPDDAQAAVERIVATLRDAAPRVAGSGEPEIVVRLAATRYLPDTLRAYLALPPDWARNHRFGDGRTPAEVLLRQLGGLELAVSGMRDAAVGRDAAALLVNGRFLTDRFDVSSLDVS